MVLVQFEYLHLDSECKVLIGRFDGDTCQRSKHVNSTYIATVNADDADSLLSKAVSALNPQIDLKKEQNLAINSLLNNGKGCTGCVFVTYRLWKKALCFKFLTW